MNNDLGATLSAATGEKTHLDDSRDQIAKILYPNKNKLTMSARVQTKNEGGCLILEEKGKAHRTR